MKFKNTKPDFRACPPDTNPSRQARKSHYNFLLVMASVAIVVKGYFSSIHRKEGSGNLGNLGNFDKVGMALAGILDSFHS